MKLNFIINNKLRNFSYKKNSFLNKFAFARYFSVFIKTQNTPNPNFIKFLPGTQVMDGTYDIPNLRQALVSPLAKQLFEIEGVMRVFYGNDYISVGKKELLEWEVIKPQIIDIICNHFTKGNQLFTSNPEPKDTVIHPDDLEAVKLIKEIIATRVRPIVQDDGGDIKFIEFDQEKGIVYLAMKGSCSGCPSSSVTLKNGIEKMLMHYVAEVKSVEEVDDDEDE